MKNTLMFLLAFSLMLTAPLAYAGVYINLVAANGSSTEKKEIPVKYYLPRELREDDILNTANLKLEYDTDKSLYYVSGSVELAPKESKTIKIEVKDVWFIAPEEVSMLKIRIDQNLSILQGTPFYDTAKILGGSMQNKLDVFMTDQQGFSDNIERRIEEYRARAESLEEIRRNAFSPEYLKSPISQEDAGVKTVKFIIEVKNSSDKDRVLKQKHYLPKELRSENIVDPQGFNVRFDEVREQSYLAKDEEFKGGQTKRYEIVIKDIWNIPEAKINSLQKRVDTAFEGVKDSEYKESAKYLSDFIKEKIAAIESSQKSREDVAKYVGAFRTNKQRYAEIEDGLIKLEKMLAAVQAKKLEEFEHSKVTNVLQKLKALRGITALSQAVFGKKPSITQTWRVIWGVLAFVAFFTAIHFFTWWKKSQIMGEEMAIEAGSVMKKITEAKEKDEAEEKK